MTDDNSRDHGLVSGLFFGRNARPVKAGSLGAPYRNHTDAIPTLYRRDAEQGFFRVFIALT